MTVEWQDDHLTLYGGDCRQVLAELPAESVHCVVTSPPYWGLRDYGTATWEGARDWRDLAAAQEHRGASQNGATGKNTLTGNGTVPSLRPALSETTGWRSTCAHDAEPVPAVVLDPFAGSGTTLLVAQSLGRRGIGIDLSPDYLKQALLRNRQTPLGLIG